MDMPFWLVPQLVLREFASVKIPSAFGRNIRQDLSAGPAAVNLRSRCEHFYELALELHKIAPGLRIDPQDPTELSLGKFATETFQKRYETLVAESLLGGGLACTDARVLRMTNEERRLHDVSSISRRALKSWEFDGKRMESHAERQLDIVASFSKRQRRT